MFLPLSIVFVSSVAVQPFYFEFCSGFSVVDMEIISAKEKADTLVWFRPEEPLYR